MMFFLVKSGQAVMSPREVCAIESASHHNPSMTILVVFVLPVTQLRLEKNLALVEVLRCWPNVRLATVDAKAAMSLVTKIPSGRSHPAAAHTSDVLRLLLVLKFGGVYADFDLVMLRSLQSRVHSDNFMVGEVDDDFSSDFFGFQRNHTLAKRCGNFFILTLNIFFIQNRV